MALTSSFNEANAIFGILDRERLAIWQAHPDWPEERRLEAWSRRKSEIASYLASDSSTPRHLQQELGSTLSQAQGSGQERRVGGFFVALTGSD